MNKYINYVLHPRKIINRLTQNRLFIMSDKAYVKSKYKERMGKKLNLDNPQTFNEKLQWLKLYDRKDIYTTMVDKYEAKEYVKNIIGDEYIIKTLGVFEKFHDIDFNSLPNKFVMKCTHDSGGLVICKDKESLDIAMAREKINKSLKRNYFYYGREWPYKNVKPRIIIEEYLEDELTPDLKDYKFFCFNGKIQTILVCSNRNGKFKNTNFYDTKWNLQEFTREKHECCKDEISKPKKLDEMIRISEILSKDIPFVRVDLYEINGKVYFGELTFFPSSGFEGFNPEKYDRILGDMLVLPKEDERKNEK